MGYKVLDPPNHVGAKYNESFFYIEGKMKKWATYRYMIKIFIHFNG